MKWVRVEDTTWPVDVQDEDTDSLEWRLRYAPSHVTPSELMSAASILSAYAHLTGGMFPRDSLRRARKARRSAGDQ